MTLLLLLEQRLKRWVRANFVCDSEVNPSPILKITAWKSHREAVQTFTANTWTDITFDLKIDAECLDGISYLNEGEVGEDKSILVIEGFNDIFQVGGCVHFDWTGNAGTACSVFTRILYSVNEGADWIEARCLQTNDVEQRGLAAEGTQLYAGTIKVNGTTWVKLQVRVSNAAMQLKGDAIFENPVAATIHMNNIGNNQEVT
jgi:hypothetical protein